MCGFAGFVGNVDGTNMKAPNAVNIKPYMIPRLKPTFFNSIPDGTAITK